MILRVWYLGDAPEHSIGAPYLHREVEDYIAGLIHRGMVDPDKTEAPDLAVTDARGITTFVAAYGLNQLAVANVQGIGLLSGYPGKMAFVGIAQKMTIVESAPAHNHTIETERFVDQDTGQTFVRAIPPDTMTANWTAPRTELRLRGLIVDDKRLEDTMLYVESKITKKLNGKVDIML